MANALQFVDSEAAPAEEKAAPSKVWQYGYGAWDESTGRVAHFTALPHFTGSAWQGAADWPEAELGWAQLTAKGGHPGNDRRHAVVRRWICPEDGRYDLKSVLIHEPKVGDGIRAFMSHSRLGKLRSETVLGKTATIDLKAIDLREGETLDFVVDINNGLNSDQFLWAPKLLRSHPITTGSGGDALEVWDAEKDFPSQPQAPLTAWEQIVQVLMLSNEFMFVD